MPLPINPTDNQVETDDDGIAKRWNGTYRVWLIDGTATSTADEVVTAVTTYTTVVDFENDAAAIVGDRALIGGVWYEKDSTGTPKPDALTVTDATLATFDATADQVANYRLVLNTDNNRLYRATAVGAGNLIEISEGGGNDVWPPTTDGMTVPDEIGLQYILVDGHTINLPDFTQTENFDIELAPQVPWDTPLTYTINEAAGWTLGSSVAASGTETIRLIVDVNAKTISPSVGGSTPAQFGIVDKIADIPDPTTTTLSVAFVAEETTTGDGTRGTYYLRVIAGVRIWDKE